MVLRTGEQTTSKSKRAKSLNKNKLLRAIQKSADEAYPPLANKPLCAKADFERCALLHQQQKEKQKTATATSGVYERATFVVKPKPINIEDRSQQVIEETVVSKESSDTDFIEIGILDKDLFLSDSSRDSVVLENKPGDRAFSETVLSTDNNNEIKAIDGESGIADHQKTQNVHRTGKKQKLSTSTSSSDSQGSETKTKRSRTNSSDSVSSSDSSSSSSSSSSYCSNCSEKSGGSKSGDSISKTEGKKPIEVSIKEVSDDEQLSLFAQLGALADSLAGSTAVKSSKAAQLAIVEKQRESAPITAPSIEGTPQGPIQVVASPKKTETESVINIGTVSSKSNPTKVHTEPLDTQEVKRKVHPTNFKSRLPKESLETNNSVPKSRGDILNIKHRVERNISHSLGQPYQLPRIAPPPPKVHSPTFARFNYGLVYGPPPAEPVPQITIVNNYYGNSRNINRGHYRGANRGNYRQRGNQRQGQPQPRSEDQGFKVLAQAEIDLLTREAKRRYYKNLERHQSNPSSNNQEG